MKKLFALVLCVVLAASVMSFASAATLEEIQAAGVLVVETEAKYAPYEFLDDDRNVIGCDIWLAQQIADEIGVQLQILDVEFDLIITDIRNGNADLGIAAFTRNEERAQVIDFSNLYETSAQLLVVKAGNGDLYSTKEALAGLKVGAQMGTVQSMLVTSVFGEAALFEMGDYPTLAEEVKKGTIAGFVADAAVAEGFVATNVGALEVSAFVFTAEEASFGKAVVLQQGNYELLTVVNQVIDRVTADGSYQAAYDAAVAASGVTGD